MKRGFSILFALVVCFAARGFSQSTAPAPDMQFANAYLTLGVGLDGTSGVDKGYGYAAYAKKVSMFNGSTNFPVYWYSEAKAYSFQALKGFIRNVPITTTTQAIDFTTGFLYPFYGRKLGGFNVLLAINGNIGPTVAGPNVGWTIGAKVIGNVNRDSWKHWSITGSVSPSKSSIAGTHLTQYAIGPTYSFAGF